MHITT